VERKESVQKSPSTKERNDYAKTGIKRKNKNIFRAV
jgi:hypothetical protein